MAAKPAKSPMTTLAREPRAVHGRVCPAALCVAALYLALLLGTNLAWEAAHVRLYTLWAEGTPGRIAWAVLHCTAGDGVLGITALAGAVLVTGAWRWPAEGFWRVALATTLIGLLATVLIEWLAVEVWGRWAYTASMPRLAPLGTALTPVLQWAVLPPICLLAARRLAAGPQHAPGGLP